jgi:hypothetical protein
MHVSFLSGIVCVWSLGSGLRGGGRVEMGYAQIIYGALCALAWPVLQVDLWCICRSRRRCVATLSLMVCDCRLAKDWTVAPHTLTC